MTDEEILRIIEEAVRSETDNPTIEITPATTADDVPGWDSLAHGRIMLTIEIALSARIDIEKTYAASCIGDLIPIIRSAIGAQQGR